MNMRTPMSLMLVASFLAACGGDEPTTAPGGSMDASVESDMGQEWDAELEPDARSNNEGARITVTPTELELTADVGEVSAPKTLTINNSGSAGLEIRRIEVDPPELASAFRLVNAPELPVVVEPQGSLEVDVTYEVSVPEDRRASLTIQSNSIRQSELTVPMLGRQIRHCAQMTPTVVQLGSVNFGAFSGRFVVNIINCGDVPFDLTDVQLEGDDDGFEFDIEGRAGGETPTLDRGDSVGIGVRYNNTMLGAGQEARSSLVVQTTSTDKPEMRANISAQGGAVERCLLQLSTEQGTNMEGDVVLDFATLRVGLERTLPVQIRNAGTGDCELRDIEVEAMMGDAANLFRVTGMPDLENNIIAGLSTQEIQLTYAPTVPNPIGERATLYVRYRDPFENLNAAQSVNLTGLGAEALIGAVSENNEALPSGLNFRKVTAPGLVHANGCGSKHLEIFAKNVGFVPIRVTGFELNGDGCSTFSLIEHTDIGDGLDLDRFEGPRFVFQFQPDVVGDASCDLIVSSDAQNTESLRIPLRGEGTADASRDDEFNSPGPNRDRPTRFTLSYDAVPESIEVQVNEEPTQAATFEEDENRIAFRGDDRPEEDDTVRVDYDAVCHDRD